MIRIVLTIGVKSILQLQVNMGVFFAIVAGVFYSGYLLITEKSRVQIDTFTFMTITVLIGTIYTLLVNIFIDTKLYGHTNFVWLNLIGLGIISHFIGWVAINYSLGHLPASNVSVTLLGQVLVTTVLAFFLEKNYSYYNNIGCLILLAGIYIANSENR